ncbi:MAG TPA: anti-sigma factor [Blastocatellia bacterium]|nr:anti-sigma factor [Blastocatellia bacterium]
MKHDKITAETLETAALYALGALSQIEARAFERHIREECPACGAALSQFDGVVQELGFSAPEAVPSPYLRDVLVSRLERESISPNSVLSLPERQEPSAQVEWPRPEPRRSFSFIPWAIAASLAIAALASFFAWRQADQSNTALEQELATAQTQLQQYAELREAEDIKLIKLEGQAPAPNATAEIYWDTASNRWIVTASLPPPPPGKVYQLWFVTPETQVSAGLIKPDQSGQGLALVPVPASIKEVAAAAITLEPEGGSEKPTLPIYAVGKVT